MIARILAVWKAGAAYVPIDPSYPASRIAFILRDTAARLVVADPAYRERLGTLAWDRETRAAIDILVPQEAPLQDRPNRAPHRTTGSDDLAYAIYTSGTTGQPKAVLVEHRGVVNLRRWRRLSRSIAARVGTYCCRFPTSFSITSSNR